MNIFLTVAVSVCFWQLIDADLLRPSLFPKNIPPYITFVRDSSIQQIPTVLKKYLVWRTCRSVDSRCIHDVVQRSGNSRFCLLLSSGAASTWAWVLCNFHFKDSITWPCSLGQKVLTCMRWDELIFYLFLTTLFVYELVNQARIVKS